MASLRLRLPSTTVIAALILFFTQTSAEFRFKSAVVTFNHTSTATSYDTILKNVTEAKVSFNLLSMVYKINPKNNGLFLKVQNLLCDLEIKSYIQRSTGTSHGWDVFFFSFTFLKTITQFLMSIMMGMGWNFIKPYLEDRDKKVMMIILPLNVAANLAQGMGSFVQDWHRWRLVFLVFDMICFCAVLFPIIWSSKNMREAARTYGKKTVNLKLFRRYYATVICYIYVTRFTIYGLETMTTYRYAWTSVMATELGTLAFYVFTGYTFRPESDNPYLVIPDEEEHDFLEDKLELIS